MNNPKKLFGLILAGGFSRRMGQDKALLNYHGKPQIEFVYDLLKSCCDDVFLSKRNDQSSYLAIPFINDNDSLKGEGPLFGILSAMKMYPDVSFLVMACDLPFVNSHTLEYLIQERDSLKMATAFKSTSDGLPEPLCAIWEGHSYQKILELFNQGISCPRKVLIKSDIKLIEQNNPRWLDNVNDIDELNKVRKALKG